MTSKQYAFLTLMEACAEVSVNATKLIKFGASEQESEDHEDNETRLLRSIADLEEIVEVLRSRDCLGHLSSTEYAIQRDKKRRAIATLLNYSVSLGETILPLEQANHGRI